MKKLNILVFLVMMSVLVSVAGVMAVTYDSSLTLENKNSLWGIISDTTQATLNYNSVGPTFEYSFIATGLAASTEYSLIYYADKTDRINNWGGNNPGAFIAKGTSDSSGGLNLIGSKGLGMDLPSEPDENIDTYNYCGTPDFYVICHGAKIWLVPSADYNENEKRVINWNPTEWLFETNLIHYYFEGSDSEDVGGNLGYGVSISVSPSSLEFGAIPRGTDITKEAINDPVIINTLGSDTETNNVYVYTDVIGTDDLFFKSLLELNDLVWTNILLIALIIPEGTSENYDARLHGDTTTYLSGPKSATIVYTAYGSPII